MLNISDIEKKLGKQTRSTSGNAKSLPDLFECATKRGVFCIDVRKLPHNTMIMANIFGQLREAQNGYLPPHQYKVGRFTDEDDNEVEVHPQERVNAWMIAATDWENVS